MSYEIFVPRTINLEADTHNGGVTADSVEGVAAFVETSVRRVFLVQLFFALLAAAVVVWFLHDNWFPTVRDAIGNLPQRGEIRGGYFIAGVSGEQFALPEAIGLLRSIRKSSANMELITLSAADPLNLQGILTPGSRIAAFTANRVSFRNGLPLAALEGGEVRKLSEEAVPDSEIETALKVGRLRPSLRPYYK